MYPTDPRPRRRLPLRWIAIAALFMVAVVVAPSEADDSGDDVAECRGYRGAGGPCSYGPGGGLHAGARGGRSRAPGGGLHSGPGGGLHTGPGGGMHTGPGGGLYSGPGGGLYPGPGGGIYPGPRTEDGYQGPWGPCITGVLGRRWMQENCPS